MRPTTITQHVPDILDSLAQLSSDEVPTPPKLARAMLSMLPSYVWSDPNLRWLDPCCKSGVFLREIAARLLVGLAEWESDFEKRREHIFRNMLYGTSITEMTGIISRRSLYYSRDSSGEQSVVRFNTDAGNLPFVSTQHTFGPNRACVICGAPHDLERGTARENYAYSFIHGTYPTKEMSDMKFDVIVGNPPYQINSNGNTRTKPVYHKFVQQAIEQAPRYVLMITPSRWFTGGLGLDEFRDRMINDRRLRKIVDNPKLFDCFPGVEIKGGVSFFLWDREHDGDCEFSTRVNGEITSTLVRDLRAGRGVLLRDNRAASIVSKVREKTTESVEQLFGPQVPFGLRTNFKYAQSQPFDGSVPLIFSNRVGYVRLEQLERNREWVSRWKVLLPGAGDGHGREVSYVLGEPIALAPGSACTQTYFVAGMFDSREKTEHYAHYLATKFVRFLVLQRKSTQHVTPDRFRFVPKMDMNRRWSEDDLYEYFDLTDDERSYIESTLAPRAVNLSLDSPIPASHLPGGSKYGASGDLDSESDDE